MRLRELLTKENIATITAALVLIIAAVYCVYSGNTRLIEYLAATTTGYLFGKLSSSSSRS